MEVEYKRAGGPSACINCGQPLHRKSEHYCSKKCETEFKSKNEEAPAFLSKWKLRKQKEERDPLITIRKQTRNKSHELLKNGKIKRKPCVVCNSNDALMHHEDYQNPYNVIWLCEQHHNEYHEGKIGLFNGRLWWNPKRLIPKSHKQMGKSKKYALLQNQHIQSKKDPN